MEKVDLKKDNIKQWYVSNFELFEDSLNGSKEIPFHKMRQAAIAKFAELGFPTPRNEEWKYTNVSPILQHKFKLLPEQLQWSADRVDQFTFRDLKENLIVFVNGQYSKKLSTLNIGNGEVIVRSLGNALTGHSDIVNKYLGKYAKFNEETFTALNTAFISDGTFVYIPDNTVVTETIHLVHLSDSSSDPFVSHPRNLFVVGKNSQVKIIESFHGLSDTTYFNNLVGEIIVDENANVDYLKIQEESGTAFHISNTHVHQERNSVFSSVNIDLGGSLVRNNLNVTLNDQNCEIHLFGFYMGNGSQHIDNHTFIDHAMPHCFSNELYKGILDDKAKGVFSGKILVRPDAQKTNALQSNKTLLLTDDASINTKPQLEIFADDVKCTHGATIGQLDDEALFYLRTRGIGEEMAGALLRHAFISDVLENIKDESVREEMDSKIIARFTNGNKA